MTSRHHSALAGLAEITTQADDLDRRRDRLVARAGRAGHAGATWQQIAHALDVTAQAAHKRYRHLRYDPTTGRAWHEPPLL
jgi:hypothetical protein